MDDRQLQTTTTPTIRTTTTPATTVATCGFLSVLKPHGATGQVGHRIHATVETVGDDDNDDGGGGDDDDNDDDNNDDSDDSMTTTMTH